MKNTVLTASIVSNMFLIALLYAFASGHMERREPDFLQEISAAPVHLTRK